MRVVVKWLQWEDMVLPIPNRAKTQLMLLIKRKKIDEVLAKYCFPDGKIRFSMKEVLTNDSDKIVPYSIELTDLVASVHREVAKNLLKTNPQHKKMMHSDMSEAEIIDCFGLMWTIANLWKKINELSSENTENNDYILVKISGVWYLYGKILKTWNQLTITEVIVMDLDRTYVDRSKSSLRINWNIKVWEDANIEGVPQNYVVYIYLMKNNITKNKVQS